MSLEVFWGTVRLAAERVASSESDDPRDNAVPSPDAPTVQRSLPSDLDLWLSPAVVSDFKPADFDFLSDEERAELEKLVEDFRKVAQEVDPMNPTTKAERDEAKPLLKRIIEFLEFDRYQDPDALRLGKLIERELAGRDLSEIKRWEFKTDYDHAGDPGIWIWAYLSDAAVETEEKFRYNIRRIRPIIDSAARKIAPDRWPYIAFRSIGELAYIEEVQRAQ